MASWDTQTGDSLAQALPGDAADCHPGSPARTIGGLVVTILVTLLFWHLLPSSWQAKEAIKDPIPARYGVERSSMRIGHVLLTFPVHLFTHFTHFWFRVYQGHVIWEFSAVAVFWIVGAALISWRTAVGAAHWIKSIVTGRGINRHSHAESVAADSRFPPHHPAVVIEIREFFRTSALRLRALDYAAGN
jgi:hypothetical protein